MQFLTSISPTRLDIQAEAINTWKKYNIPIISVQCIGEDYAKDFVDNIVWVESCKDWSKRTPSLISILQQVTEPTILINSDIQLKLPTLDDWVPQSKVLKVGLRTDFSIRYRQLNKYGVDVYLLTVDMIEFLSNSIHYAIGIPGWDYYVILRLLQEGYHLGVYNKDILHLNHKEQWSPVDYDRCGRLLQDEFHKSLHEITNQIQLLTNRRPT